MPEKIEELIKQAIAAAQAAGDLAAFEVGDCGVERPADAGNGDWTSMVALRSARLARTAPTKIATALVAHSLQMIRSPRLRLQVLASSTST
jgi:arginyl-tRNA synthetase